MPQKLLSDKIPDGRLIKFALGVWRGTSYACWLVYANLSRTGEVLCQIVRIYLDLLPALVFTNRCSIPRTYAGD
jgi:hypothetical protein